MGFIRLELLTASSKVHIYYCGHGTKSGNIPTYDRNYDGESIDLKDIVSLIREMNFTGSVFLELDFSFSGSWIEQFETLRDTGQLDGIMLWLQTECGKDKNIEWNAALPKIKAQINND